MRPDTKADGLALRVVAAFWLGLLAPITSLAAPLPPGRQHRLTIEGTNTVTFVPRTNLPPAHLDYSVKVEYIVDARYGKPAKAAEDEPADPPAEEPVAAPEKPKAPTKKAGAAKRAGARAAPGPKITGAIDLSLHSLERRYRQDGRALLETRASRSRFRGRVQPESPTFDVSAKDAPPMVQEVLKNFDLVAATMQLDDDLRVVARKYRFEGPQRPVLETLLSIHTPIPRGLDTWESPTQLAMGHGQTAKGMLRFEKAKQPEPGPTSDLVKVKVSGVLKAEGVVAGQFIKDGTYTVTGEQVFDGHKHEWTSSRWSVEVASELANQAGQPVAQAKGKMTVESRAVEPPGDPATPRP